MAQSKVGMYLVPKQSWWARPEPYGVPLNDRCNPTHVALAYDPNMIYRIEQDKTGAYGTRNNGCLVFIMKADCVVRPTVPKAMEHIRRRNAREAKTKIAAVAG